MKFTFFKRRKEIAENRFRIAMLEEERNELIKKLSEVKLSKSNKISKLISEITDLKQKNEILEERIKIHEDIEKSQSSTNKILEEMNQNSNEKINSLTKKVFELKLMVPEQFPIEDIMGDCANKAWYGGKSDRTFESVDGKIKLFFQGTVYEPSYESFTAGCCVYYLEQNMDKKKSLYTVDSRNVAAYKNEVVKSGSVSDIKKYLIDKNVGFKEV